LSERKEDAARVAGDIAMLETESHAGGVKARRNKRRKMKNGQDVVASPSHDEERPLVIFLHYWAEVRPRKS